MVKTFLILAIPFFLISCAHKPKENVTRKLIKQEIKKTEKKRMKTDTMDTIKQSVDTIKNMDLPETKNRK
jgi:hypothetical protein